jgi:hypothetical protein
LTLLRFGCLFSGSEPVKTARQAGADSQGTSFGERTAKQRTIKSVPKESNAND